MARAEATKAKAVVEVKQLTAVIGPLKGPVGTPVRSRGNARWHGSGDAPEREVDGYGSGEPNPMALGPRPNTLKDPSSTPGQTFSAC